MSARKAGYRVIHVSAGVFPTLDAARKEADCIKAWLVRRCPKKGYTCKAIIGVSENNPHTGEVTTCAKAGKRGRPKKEFVRTNGVMQPTKTDPHIHIIIYAEPAETVAKEVATRLNAKYGRGKRIAWVKNCGGYTEAATRYILRQSIKIRTVNCENGDICSNSVMDSFSFTLLAAWQAERTAENTRLSALQATAARLPYNSYKNFILENHNFVTTFKRNFSVLSKTFLTNPFIREYFDTCFLSVLSLAYLKSSSF
ncbi:MAG: hypothetical protein IJP94_02075 [Clostridia bacterium]|nr:hypothetical protein [Clostridia bacterium]